MFGRVLPVLWQLSSDGMEMALFTANSGQLAIIQPCEPYNGCLLSIPADLSDLLHVVALPAVVYFVVGAET